MRSRKMARMKFLRQYGIGEYIADFYCPSRKLIIELDGAQHSSIEGKDYDKVRDDYMISLGLKTIRFSNADVLQNMEGVLARIRSELTL